MGNLRDFKKDLLKIYPDFNFNKDESIVGNKILAKRSLLDISIEELAGSTNLSVSEIKKIEGGLKPFNIDEPSYVAVFNRLNISKQEVLDTIKEIKIDINNI